MKVTPIKNGVYEPKWVDHFRAFLCFSLWIIVISKSVSQLFYVGFLFGGFLIFLDFLSNRLKKIHEIFKFFSVLFMLLLLILGAKTFTSQLAYIFNLISNTFYERFSILLPLFETKDSNVFAQGFFYAFFAFLILVTIKSSHRLPAFLLSFTMLILTFLLSDSAVILAFSVFSGLVLTFGRSEKSNNAGRFVVCALFSAVFGLAFSLQSISDFSEKLNENVVNLLYGAKGFSQPNGNLSDAKAFNPTGETMLEVVMSEPEAMYLHGFLGYEYNDGVWTVPDFDNEIVSQNDFNYLKSVNFNMQNQSIKLISLIDSFSENTVTVRSLGADSRYFYLPVACDFENLSTFYYLGLLENYSYFSKENSIYTVKTVKDYLDYIQTFVESAKKITESSNGIANDYLQNSAVYDEFCSTQFTKIPENISNILSAQLGSYSYKSGDLSGAAAVIYDYLGEFSYDESVENVSLENFLQTKKSGWSIHFASAAVMIFRYYGIPARYAEGYAVTNSDAEGKLSGTPIILNDFDFHAWVEYYIEGVGWIPFEATPEYFDKMPLSDGISVENTVSYEKIEIDSGQTSQLLSGNRLIPEIVIDKTEKFDCIYLIIFVLLLIAILFVTYQLIFYKKISQDPDFALQMCVRKLRKKFEININSDGLYNFDTCKKSKLFDDLITLQNYCIDEFYSHKNNNYTLTINCVKLYSSCRKMLKIHNRKLGKLHKSDRGLL